MSSERLGGRRRLFRLAGLALAAVLTAFAATSSSVAGEKSIVVASTTSTQDSGLFGYLLPLFKAKTGIDVKVVAQGTGQALDTGRRGDADVVFVHAKAQEEAFVVEGAGVKRFDVMYNDFVLVGPKDDPAKIKGTKDIAAALKTIATMQAPFISRGDRSGTHLAELRLWKAAGFESDHLTGSWYRSIGQGMGATLNMADAVSAYALTDRGTWLAWRARKSATPLEIVIEGDKKLFNQYGVILVNPQRYPHVKKELGQAFIDWLIGPEGQAAIAGYKVQGAQIFFPNAKGS